MKHANETTTALQKILKMQCEICKALGHTLRLAIVDKLANKETAAADLLSEMGISKVNLSKHMALLIHAGIVEARRDGRNIFYRQ